MHKACAKTKDRRSMSFRKHHNRYIMAAILSATSEFPLHESVFKNDRKRLSALLRTHDVSEKDVHGNTALHLAVMLGNKECIHLLLAHDAPVRVKNLQGWNSLAEAVSYGDRQTIITLLRRFKQQSRELLEVKRPQLIQALEDLGDFYLELRWDFQSWIPLVSRMLPSDTCRILKRGTRIRMDTTLVDFNDMRWQRGNNTFIFNGDAKPDSSLVVLDNNNKLYQRVRYQETDKELEEEVDILMSSDIVTMTLSTKPITFTRTQSGWLFRDGRCQTVGNFSAKVYSISNVVIQTRKRRGHLTQEDIQKNKAAIESFSKGTVLPADLQPQHRPSLPPPQPTDISWSDYIKARPSRVHLGRPQVCKEHKKVFKATVALSEDFPLELQDILNILEVLTPMRHFQKLRDFISIKMPPGFPIRIDVPVLPTITARVTFQDFQFRDNISPALFKIPRDYKQDASRFPEL